MHLFSALTRSEYSPRFTDVVSIMYEVSAYAAPVPAMADLARFTSCFAALEHSGAPGCPYDAHLERVSSATSPRF